MPLYDYECLSCGHVFELRQSFNDEPVGSCPRCEGSSRRKFHAVPVIYKGTGFYTTDYGRSKVGANGTGANSSKDEEKESDKTPSSSSKDKKEESSKAPSTSSKPES